MDSGSDYPRPLKLIQDGKTKDFIHLINSSDDVQSFMNIRHKKSGDNAGIIAARFGRLGILEILHENGMDFEQRNDDGKRALHEASYGSHLDCVKFLISVEVEIDCLKRADWTPLLLACTKQDLCVISTLIKAGANMAQCNKDGWDCFHVAAREGHVNILEYLLENLMKSGIWSNKSKSKNGRTPLHTAALHGKAKAVQFMVNNCDFMPDTPDSCGATPLMDALRSGHVDVADFLVKHHKASIQKCDKLGSQPIHLAAQTGHIESLDYLITQHDLDPQTRTQGTEMTPLHFAAKEGHLHVLNYLLIKLVVDVDAQDARGRTAFHLASAAGFDECVSSLQQDHNANPSIRDINEMAAWDFALKPSIKSVLEKSSRKVAI